MSVNLTHIDANKFPIVSAANDKRPSLVERQFENLGPNQDSVSALIERVHNAFFHNDLTEDLVKDHFDMRRKVKNNDGSFTHVGKRQPDGSFLVLDHKLPKREGGIHKFELKRLTKNGDNGFRSIGVDSDEKEALKKAMAGMAFNKDLKEAEAPNYRPDRLMSMSNPIASHDFQDFSPNSFSAGNVSKTPTRLADAKGALQDYPLEQRNQQESDSHQVSPSRLPPDMSVDWHADIPEKLLNPDVDIDLQPEEEVFPIFNQYRDQAWIQSGPPSALVASEFMEPGTLIMEEDDSGFDYSYMNHPVFQKNFANNPSHKHEGYDTGSHHHVVASDDGSQTTHHIRIHRGQIEPNTYSAEIYSDAPGNGGHRRSGYGVGKTSLDAMNVAHQNYKENLKVPSYVKEERLDELSKNTLGKYIHKATDDLSITSNVLGKEGDRFPRMAETARQVIKRRKIGIDRAAKKLTEKSVERFQPLGDEVDSGLDEAFFDPNGKSLEVLLNTHSRNCAGGSDHCRDVSRQIEDYVKSHHGKDAHDNLRAYSAIRALAKQTPDSSLMGKLREKDQSEKFRDAFFKAAENHLHSKKRADQ